MPTDSDALTKCREKFFKSWLRAELRAAGQCPSPPGADETVADLTTVEYVDWAIGFIQGGEPEICVGAAAECYADLAACNDDLGACEVDLENTGNALEVCIGDLAESESLRALCNEERNSLETQLSVCQLTVGSLGADLGRCESSLTQVSEALGEANASLATCTSSLQQTVAQLVEVGESLLECQGDLAVTAGELTTCQATLSQTAADLATCEADLAQCLASQNQPTRCDITFSVTSSPPGGVLGALSFDTVYPPDSNFDGADSAVICAPLAGGVLASFNNQEGNNTLLTGIIGIPGLSAPGDVSQCSYLSASGVPTAADFAITVTDANTGSPEDVTATTTVEITAIACDDTPVTTTTSTSTTTTTAGPTAEYDVFFAIAEAATYGALQFTANYSAAPGGFIGSGAGVDCALVPAAQTLNAFNDIEAESNLNIGIIALFGFTTSAGEQIVRCGFEGTSMPTAGDFVVTVQDSSDTGGQPLAATISIGNIVPRP